MVYIEPQGVGACEEYVDAEVELELINEKGVFNVTLDDVFVSVEDVLDITSQEDTPSLRKCLRLDDVGACLALLYALVVMAKLAEL